jgi:hypothetical protein
MLYARKTSMITIQILRALLYHIQRTNLITPWRYKLRLRMGRVAISQPF